MAQINERKEKITNKKKISAKKFITNEPNTNIANSPRFGQDDYDSIFNLDTPNSHMTRNKSYDNLSNNLN